MTQAEVKPRTFVRRERAHIDVLQERLDYLRSEAARTDPAGRFKGEAHALAWVLSVLHGQVEPIEIRVERIEDKLRRIETRLGRIEREWEDDE